MVVMPLFHCGAAVTAISYLAGGTTLRLVRDFEPARVLEILQRERIVATNLVPTMIQSLLAEPSVGGGAYPDLDLIVYGAAPIQTDLLRRAIEVFGCRFIQAYGMTELGAVTTLLNPEDHVRALQSSPGLLLSAGRPLVGTEVRIVDDDDRDLPVGRIGQVLVRGPQMMTAYWRRPEATTEALRGGWMHTGDAGYVDGEGFLYLTDRLHDMVISGGENVYPREIEEILGQLDGVLDAAVIGVPDKRWGEAIKAIVVRQPAAHLTEDAVIAHCRTLLARYKCPKTVDFVDALPRTATGKVLKRELRERHGASHARDIN
jgi:fatty-acyl-CoA synthase